jgi:hypothetical protein
MIRDLGGWESVEMVERYTRSLEKEKALQFYKSPFGNSLDEFKNQIGIQPDITSIIQRELGGKMDIDDIDKLIAKLKVGLPTLSP